MLVTKTRAAELAGISRRTFYNHIPKKKISLTLNDNGEEFVEVSELERVYGKEKVSRNLKDKMEVGPNGMQEREPAHATVQGNVKYETLLLQQQVDALKEKNAALETSARREREQSQDEKENLRESLKLAQEGQNRITLILEDQRAKEAGAGEWERSFKAIEARLANQEKAEKNREEREEKILRQNKALRKALQEERSRGFLKKLFG